MKDLEKCCKISRLWCRFLCRAQQAEVAKAKARTQYIPQGPGVEDEGGTETSTHQKQQHAHAADNDWQFWNSYFQKVPTTAARQAMAHRQRQRQHARRSAQQNAYQEHDDGDTEDEEEGLSDVSGYSAYFSDGPDGTDDEYDMDNKFGAIGNTASAANMSAEEQAHRQLLLFVQRLPACVTSSPAAAVLKSWSLPQVRFSKQCCYMLML